MGMNNSFTEKSLVFLLGAGFNFDAASEAGHPQGVSSAHPPRYPMVRDLLDACFTSCDSLPAQRTIEDLFQESIDIGNTEPLEKLYALLKEADYFITPHLRGGGGREENAYLKFLTDFPDAPLLTFNYDSLPEILLLAERTWSPQDGYGVAVEAETGWVRDRIAIPDNSRRHVLHLHGSLCIYTANFDTKTSSRSEFPLLQHRDRPDFRFDPDNLADCFFSFCANFPRHSKLYTHHYRPSDCTGTRQS